jgi:hypothetical protein
VRNLRTALCSFLLGLICASLGNHRIAPSSVFAQVNAPSTSLPRNPYIPLVPPFGRSLQEGNSHGGGDSLLMLDGKNSFREEFDDGTTIVYGGGSYNMQGAVFSGRINIELIGAAANTVKFLETFGLLANSPQPSPPAAIMNTPITKTTRTTIRGDFVSPYDGKGKQ